MFPSHLTYKGMARMLTCPNSGAPLKWKGEVRVIECGYCRKHSLPCSRLVEDDANFEAPGEIERVERRVKIRQHIGSIAINADV